MIIGWPTGLYNSELITAGNVTFTISSYPPPRPVDAYTQIPIARQAQPRPKAEYNPAERREIVSGELVVETTQGDPTTVGSNKKQFTVGDLLDFDDISTLEGLPLTAVPESIQVQYNTNKLDLESVGLSEEEVAELQIIAKAKKELLRSQISTLQSEIKNYEQDIAENQKDINETQKTIKAVESIDPSAPILEKLSNNLRILEEERQQLIDEATTKQTEVEALYQDLLDVSRII